MSDTHTRWTGSRALVSTFALGVAMAVTATAPRAQTGGAATGAANGHAVRINAATAAAVADWDRQIDGLKRDGALRLSVSRPDTLIEGRTHERFDQYYNGVRVFGAQTVRQVTAEGQAVSVFGTVHAQIALDTTPTLSADQAIARAAELTGGGDVLTGRAPELLVLPYGDNQYALAWLLHVGLRTDFISLFIDAKSGAELRRFSDVHGQSQVGLGTGVLGDQKKLSTASSGGAFIASDLLRPPTIITLDLRSDLTRAYRLLTGQTTRSASDTATDTDNVWTDGAAVDAHAYLGYTYDYYFKRFNRAGLDNRNGPLVAITHAVARSRIGQYDGDTVGTYYLNAFWCGGCAADGTGIMFFGEGLPTGYYLVDSGQYVDFFSGSLDIVAHELTHGVTEYSSNLIYEGEPGALNEAFSDIIGTSVEFFFQPSKADYIMGEDSFRAYRPGSYNGIRSMSDPQAMGQPDHYSRRYIGEDDYGGVHTNSGIANHAFYLAIEGGTNRTSGQAVTGVGAANREQIEKVFYRAFTQLLPPDATFAVARQATLQAATDLYGGSSTAYRAVSQAWSAVGVN
jgi:Zn-dependent metalloprotease